MHDETQPIDPIPPAPAPSSTASFQGRTPGRGAAIRAGIVVGCALVVAIGTAVVMGASPAPSVSSNGAQPSAAAGDPSTGKPDRVRDHAAKGDRLGGRAFGRITITAISGSSVSLATEDGWTRTITVTAEASITKGGEKAALADLKVGDIVRLGQKRNDDGTWTVTALAVVLPQTAGKVTAVGADTITITGRDGAAQTIHTTGSTTYHRGKATGTRADVVVGSGIVAVGERGSDGSLTATSVRVILPRVAGTVTAVTADSITLKLRDGSTVTVHVGSGTTIGVAGVESAKIADVKTGMIAVVEGSRRADGSLDAAALRAGQGGKGFKDRIGPKAAPDASTAPGSTG